MIICCLPLLSLPIYTKQSNGIQCIYPFASIVCNPIYNPFKAVQAKLYDEAAAALADRESKALPSHGGRPWKCDVRLVEDARKTKRKNASALFRWYRGRLELAVLPHYYEKIEEVDAGIGPKKRHRDDDPSSEDGDDEDEEDLYPHIPKTDLSQREVSSLSSVAWHDPDHPGKRDICKNLEIC